MSWLLAAQHTNGGWGGTSGEHASVEETAWAVDALAGHTMDASEETNRRVDDALARGVGWLSDATRGGTEFPAAPIGFYFAKLWYYEDLYPVIFTAGALRRMRARLAATDSDRAVDAIQPRP